MERRQEKSKGNLTKMTRDCRVETSEVHHGCIKTLHFGTQVDGYLSTEFIAERVSDSRWARATVLCKEQGVVGVCVGYSLFLRKFGKNGNNRYVPRSLR